MAQSAQIPSALTASPALLMRSQYEPYQRFVTASAALFIFSGMISFIEPSPYDFTSMLAILLWFIGGFRVNKFLLGVFLVWTLREILYYIALAPYWEQPDPVLYQLQSSYLYVTVIFFTLYFAERTHERTYAALNAYMYSCFVSAMVGILGYVNILPPVSYIEERVAGTFRDPNVFGSYLTLGVCWALQSVYIRQGWQAMMSALCLAISLIGVFLSYSRGSWGAAVVSMTIVTMATFLTYRGAVRKRILVATILLVCVAAIALIVALSSDSISEIFFRRFIVTQDYDGGDNGRWGNQIRSLPMLLERPFGFGPLRYRLWFELDPHSSFVGAFANAGWAAGFLWIIIVLLTILVGLRMMIAPSPFRVYAQAIIPANWMMLIQGFQIDVDHWRMLFLQFGMVWGLEAARRRWIATNSSAETESLESSVQMKSSGDYYQPR